MSNRKTYLGDSVYADWDGWSLALTTENGGEPSNTIHLDVRVIDALMVYLDSFAEKLPPKQDPPED